MSSCAGPVVIVVEDVGVLRAHSLGLAACMYHYWHYWHRVVGIDACSVQCCASTRVYTDARFSSVAPLYRHILTLRNSAWCRPSTNPNGTVPVVLHHHCTITARVARVAGT